jgi:hypothetical protein
MQPFTTILNSRPGSHKAQPADGLETSAKPHDGRCRYHFELAVSLYLNRNFRTLAIRDKKVDHFGAFPSWSRTGAVLGPKTAISYHEVGANHWQLVCSEGKQSHV